MWLLMFKSLLKDEVSEVLNSAKGVFGGSSSSVVTALMLTIYSFCVGHSSGWQSQEGPASQSLHLWKVLHFAPVKKVNLLDFIYLVRAENETEKQSYEHQLPCF